MNIYYHERIERGTPDFPLELYVINSLHPRYKMQMHWHKEFELIHVTKGTLELKLNEKDYNLSENQSIFLPGGIIHSANPINCDYECIVFSPSVLYNMQICRTLIKAYMQKISLYSNNQIINRIFENMKSKNKGYELDVSGCLYLLASDIVQKNDGILIPPNNKLEKLKSALVMIEENYSSKLTLEELAASCRLSPNYFCKCFKEIIGQTPFEYLTVYRIEVACEMLIDDTKNITDVCLACGFNDLSYFIHVFKKYKKLSPREYAKKIIKNK